MQYARPLLQFFELFAIKFSESALHDELLESIIVDACLFLVVRTRTDDGFYHGSCCFRHVGVL